MIILNMAFMGERKDEKELRAWIEAEVMPVVRAACSEETGRLRRSLEVLEVEGQPDFSVGAFNIAIQIGFDSRGMASLWSGTVLPPLRDKLFAIFGERVVIFCTVLEETAV